VNWCPNDKTVLANEQVIDGNCERCGAAVEQRFLEQWFFSITKYAGRLLANLDWLDWSESTKTAQRNWIGRSEGAEVVFRVFDPALDAGSAAVSVTSETGGSGLDIKVFTTRPDTIFGATYLVLAPEHPLVPSLTAPDRRNAVEDYRARTNKQDLVTRKVNREKTGVFTGTYALNPATGEPVPIWIADYVLMEYGTGAIMAVPGHDERDFEFAKLFDLPIVRVVAGVEESADTPLELAAPSITGARLVNSKEFDGLSVELAKEQITSWLAGRHGARAVTNYRLHDWCISRQRYWGPPIPIIYCDSCGMQAVPEKDLPVLLPDIPDFRPDDTGVSPLARHDEWYRVPCPECGKSARRETDVSDTFLDSSWYFLRYPSVGRDDVPFDPKLTKKWLPVTSYIGGNEHSVLHLLYARFVTMVLNEAGHIDFEEPFARFRAHGTIVRDGSKMSKSRGNVVSPDQYIEQWGADTFRAYLMFLGPFEEGGDFRDAGIAGVKRFLDRLWASVASMRLEGTPDASVMRKLHQTIRKVTEDTPRLSYNTAIAAMMEYMNVLRAKERTPHREEVEPLIVLVSPFAPHIAEELWERIGHSTSIFDTQWPRFDETLAAEERIDLVIQVNGKTRARVSVAPGATEEQALAAAMADHTVKRFVTNTPKKVVFVPGRLLNLVV
jgi:leucyl-tRNA synthetase